MAKKVDEPWTKCRNSTDHDWTRAFAHDGRDPRSWPQTKLCRGQHVLEQSYTANQNGAWISCARCALRLHYIPKHIARVTSMSTPSSASVQEALKRMTLLRDNDFAANAVKDMIAEVEGRKPREKKTPPQPTIVYNKRCTIPERHPVVRRSARQLQCTEKSRSHHHLVSLR